MKKLFILQPVAVLSSGPEEQQCKSSFIKFKIMHQFSYNFRLFQMQMAISQHKLPV
jgi:hypothetical protein